MHEVGYGVDDNIDEVLIMEELDQEGKKSHIKKLWEEDPKKYFEWKEWCIRLNRLPYFFGTNDDPILIDGSKL